MDKEKESLKNEMNKQVADMALQEIDKLNKKIKILQKALQEAGKYARENVPAMMPKDSNYIGCIVDAKSDPEGMKFIRYWIELTNKEEK